MDRNLGLNLARVTEAAALAASKHYGRGDKNVADAAAVDSMRKMFDTMDINGVVVIGEGEMDEAPMLYIGEEVGLRREDSPEVDIAVDPIDGTTATAKGLSNAIAILAMAPRGCLLHAPDMYMDKIAVGPKAKGKVDLDNSMRENLEALSKVLHKDISELTVAMLDRDRHSKLVEEIREAGARIKMFSDGDVEAAIAACFDDSGIDIMVGSGGAPEGVIAAAALKCLGGDFQGRLLPENEEESKRCGQMGISDCAIKLTIDDLVKGNEVYFAATGISDGNLLKGVTFGENNIAKTHSMVTRSETGTVRFIEAIHKLDKKPDYAY
jgi:fructose-1,6-bisphosphatase II